MEIVCPRPAALLTINRVTCPENLGQIQRIAITRAGGAIFDQAAAAGAGSDITEIGSWTPQLAAADDEKIVITPYLENFIIPEGTAITEGGGDNVTIDGVERVLGTGPITVTAMLAGVPVSIIDQIRDLMGEPALEVFLFNQYGKIIARDSTPAAAEGAKVHRGIPIQSLFCPYPANNGLNTVDKATFRFAFAEDWAKNRVIITPVFNVKTDLLAPAA